MAAKMKNLLLTAIAALAAAVLLYAVFALVLSVPASAKPPYKQSWRQQFGPAWHLVAMQDANGAFSHCILMAGFQLAPPLQQRERLPSRGISVMFTGGKPPHMMALGVGARWPDDITGKVSRAEFGFLDTGKQTFDLVGRGTPDMSYYERWYNRETLRPLHQALMTDVAFTLRLNGKDFGFMPIADGQAKPAITEFFRCIDTQGRKDQSPRSKTIRRTVGQSPMGLRRRCQTEAGAEALK